jgi:hypothetical protein
MLLHVMPLVLLVLLVIPPQDIKPLNKLRLPTSQTDTLSPNRL